jgi:cytochrome c oxidase cbb3-type subunit I/II
MPSYKWLINSKLDKSQTEDKMEAMITLGVPYSLEEVERAQEWMLEQGAQIEENLYSDPDFVKTYEADKKYAAENGEDFVEMRNREVVALIAYLQRLGTDLKIKSPDEVTLTENQ